MQKENSFFFLFPSGSIFDEVKDTSKRAEYKIKKLQNGQKSH